MTHPITPPPELVQQWCDPRVTKSIHFCEQDLATRAAQWGADQELEACCEWLVSEGWFKYEHEAVEDLRAARRPKAPSLKEQAHDAYWALRYGHGGDRNETQEWNTICRALEQLDD